MPGSAQFGLMLPQVRMDVATIEARVRAAEDAGFHSVWFMDHLVAPAARELDSFEGWTIATAMASRTERIRIGHLVLCDAFRPPALLAKMAVTLDHVSNGRLELGLGWGSFPDELATFGLPDSPAPTRAGRMAETLDVLDLMFRGETFDYDGEHVQLHRAIGRPTPVQARIPLHIGGSGPQLTLPLARRYADWWNCPTYAADRLAELVPLVRGDGGRHPSREPIRISVQRPVGLAVSSGEREEVVATAERRFGSWGGLVAGTPDEVAAALQRDAHLGAELLIVQLSDFARPETIRLLMHEVAPALS
jgi:alkanesulfonate monooxygenase SsuD/methylene tetrahydromethanopterin reductase-like flavin-dependent oxidoreductase (luciferase family)